MSARARPSPRPAARAASIAGLLLALSLAPPAHAQRWYTVEVVAFEWTAPGGLAEEAWTDAPAPPSLEGAVELVSAEEQALDEELQGDEPGGDLHAFRLLPPSELRLGGVRRVLERSGRLEPLLHVAWRQPGFGSRSAPPVHVRSTPLLAPPGGPGESDGGILASGTPLALILGDARADPGPAAPARAAVDGTLRLYRARYLHLEADLLYHRPAARSRARAVSGDDGAEPDIPDRFVLRQSRRMRSNELHYVDHPLFGIVAQVTPYDPPPPPAAEPPAGSDDPEGASGG